MKRLLLAVIFALTFVHAQADVPQQALVEWQGYSDANYQVGGPNKQNFALLKNQYFKTLPSQDFQLDSTASLDDFSASLAKALQSIQSPQSILRILLNTHGEPLEFAIQDGKTDVTYDAFFRAMASVLQTSKTIPAQIELYLAPCNSGTALSSMAQYLSRSKFPNTEVKAWIGSSPNRGTEDTEFSDELLALDLQGAASQVKSILGLGDDQIQKLDLFGSLGGMSGSFYWDNLGSSLQKLAQGQLEKLTSSANLFLKQRGLIALLNGNLESTTMIPQIIQILNDTSQTQDLRNYAIQYLTYFSANSSIASALRPIAGLAYCDNNFLIKGTALQALGKADPTSYDFLMSVYNDTNQNYLIRIYALWGAAATGQNSTTLTSICRTLVEKKDPLFSTAAMTTLAIVDPQARSYFENILNNSQSDEGLQQSSFQGLISLYRKGGTPEIVYELISYYQNQSIAFLKAYLAIYLGNLAYSDSTTMAIVKASGITNRMQSFVSQNQNSQDNLVQSEVGMYQIVIWQLGS